MKTDYSKLIDDVGIQQDHSLLLSGQQEVSGWETITQMLINNDFYAIVNENYED